MIRKAKNGERVYYFSIFKDLIGYKVNKLYEKSFINNNDLLHNDVGPALILLNRNDWFWNGILIK